MCVGLACSVCVGLVCACPMCAVWQPAKMSDTNKKKHGCNKMVGPRGQEGTNKEGPRGVGPRDEEDTNRKDANEEGGRPETNCVDECIEH